MKMRELFRTLSIPVDEIHKIVRAHEPDPRGVQIVNALLQHICSKAPNILASSTQINTNGSENLKTVVDKTLPLIAGDMDLHRFQALLNTYDYNNTLRSATIADHKVFDPKNKASEEWMELNLIDNRVAVAQKPDGMFWIQVPNPDNILVNRLIIVEIDGHAKSVREPKESYALSCKALQAVDMSRCMDQTDSSTYMIRVNLKSMDFDGLRLKLSKYNNVDLRRLKKEAPTQLIKTDQTLGIMLYNMIYEELAQQILHTLMMICYDVKYKTFIASNFIPKAETQNTLDFFFMINFPNVPSITELSVNSDDRYRKECYNYLSSFTNIYLFQNDKPCHSVMCSAPGLVVKAGFIAVQRINMPRLLNALRADQPSQRYNLARKVRGMIYLTDLIQFFKNKTALENCKIIEKNGIPPIEFRKAFVPEKVNLLGVPPWEDVSTSVASKYKRPVQPDGQIITITNFQPQYELMLKPTAGGLVGVGSVGTGKFRAQPITYYFDYEPWKDDNNEYLSKFNDEKIWHGPVPFDPTKDKITNAQFHAYAHPNRMLIARFVTLAESFLYNLHDHSDTWWKPSSWSTIESFSKEYSKLLRANPDLSRSRFANPLDEKFFEQDTQIPKSKNRKGLFNRVCAKLNEDTPPLDAELASFVQKLHIPYALVFLKTIGCLNRLALQEMARRYLTGESLERIDTILEQFPPGTESEIRFLFQYVQTDMVSQLKLPEIQEDWDDFADEIDLLITQQFGVHSRDNQGNLKATTIPLCNKIRLIADIPLAKSRILSKETTFWPNFIAPPIVQSQTAFYLPENNPSFSMNKFFLLHTPGEYINVRDINYWNWNSETNPAMNSLIDTDSDDDTQVSSNTAQSQQNTAGTSAQNVSEVITFTAKDLEAKKDNMQDETDENDSNELELWSAILKVGEEKNRQPNTYLLKNFSWKKQLVQLKEWRSKYFESRSKDVDENKLLSLFFDDTKNPLHTNKYSLWFVTREISSNLDLSDDETQLCENWNKYQVLLEAANSMYTDNFEFVHFGRRKNNQIQREAELKPVALWFQWTETESTLLKSLEEQPMAQVGQFQNREYLFTLDTRWFDQAQRHRKERLVEPTEIKKEYFFEHGPSWCDIMWKRLLIKLNTLKSKVVRKKSVDILKSTKFYASCKSVDIPNNSGEATKKKCVTCINQSQDKEFDFSLEQLILPNQEAENQLTKTSRHMFAMAFFNLHVATNARFGPTSYVSNLIFGPNFFQNALNNTVQSDLHSDNIVYREIYHQALISLQNGAQSINGMYASYNDFDIPENTRIRVPLFLSGTEFLEKTSYEQDDVFKARFNTINTFIAQMSQTPDMSAETSSSFYFITQNQTSVST